MLASLARTDNIFPISDEGVPGYVAAIEIPASITAVEFYKKQGYDYKNGVNELDDEGHYRLEKFNVKKGVD